MLFLAFLISRDGSLQVYWHRLLLSQILFYYAIKYKNYSLTEIKMKKIVVVFLATFGLISFANAGEAQSLVVQRDNYRRTFQKMSGLMPDVLSCVCIRQSRG